jgi:hypothetical protein
MSVHKIRISVVGSRLTFTNFFGGSNADPKKTKPNDDLSWYCSDGPFAVFFKDGKTPDKNGRFVFSGDSSTANETKKVKIKSLGGQGQQTFAYGAAVMSGAHIVDVDPDIIIDDPGGGETRGSKKKAAKKKAAKKKAAKKKK